MLRIGVLGLDTSHSETFAEAIASTGTASVTAVWDEGNVRDTSHLDRFCEAFDATPVDEPTDVIDHVDAVMVLSVDWDTHASLAVPFLEAGIPTFVDKPIAGRLEDIEAIADAASNAPLFGSSAVPFHPNITSLPRDRSPRTITATGFKDPFYYGAHLVQTVRSLTTADWTVVMPAADPGRTVEVVFDDGSHATLQFDTPSEETKYAVLDVTDSARTSVVDMEDDLKPKMYGAFIDAFLEVVRGGRDDTARLVDGAKLSLAANIALELHRPVTPTGDALADARLDGQAFREGYADSVTAGGQLPVSQWATRPEY